MKKIWEWILNLLGKNDGKDKLPPLGSKTLKLYGRVNWWAFGDNLSESDAWKLLEKELRMLAREGWDGTVIELAGNSSLKVMSTPEKLERVKRMYKKTLNLCRKLNLWVMLSGIANDNMGGKDGIGIYIANVLPQFKSLVDFVAEQGKENVIANIVSEIQTSGGNQLEAYGLARLKSAGFAVGYNGSGQPKSKPAGYDFMFYHPSSIAASKKLNKSHAVVTDHSRIIAELSNPIAVTAWLSDMSKAGVLAASVYDYQRKTLNEPFIKAI